MNKMTLPRSAFVAALAALAYAMPASAATELPASTCSETNVNAFLATDERPRYRIDKAVFYARLREFSDFNAVYKVSGDHYRGTDAIIDHWNDHSEFRDSRWLAYILATAYHETAYRMFPVRETLASTDEQAVTRLENAYQRRGSGRVYWREVEETGEHYFGRGYVQLTWDYNYKRADTRFGHEDDRGQSFYWNPGRVLEPDASIAITYDGMIYGWYTGRCLLRHIYPNREADWIGARRIINGLDRADDIAELAGRFLIAIEAAEVLVPVAVGEGNEDGEPEGDPTKNGGGDETLPNRRHFGWLSWMFAWR